MLGPLLYGEGVTKPFGLDSSSDFLFLPWANPLHSLRRSGDEPGLPDPLVIVQGAAALCVLALQSGHEVADVAIGIQRLIAADIGQLLRAELDPEPRYV
jgi:hypothetical protein